MRKDDTYVFQSRLSFAYKILKSPCCFLTLGESCGLSSSRHCIFIFAFYRRTYDIFVVGTLRFLTQVWICITFNRTEEKNPSESCEIFRRLLSI